MNIDNGERENQFLEIDLIHRPQPLDEMRRRIDMRAPLSNVRENLRKEAGAHHVEAFLVPINGLSHFIWKSRPPRDPRFERVRQINISFRRQRLLNTPERFFTSTMQNRDAQTDDTEQKYPSQLKVHCALLTDAAATSQQLRITLNNFRLWRHFREFPRRVVGMDRSHGIGFQPREGNSFRSRSFCSCESCGNGFLNR
jgi:hypothetical protein